MKDSIICNELHQKIGNINSVLDVGCGEGYLVNCLAKKLNKKIIGFDISDNGFTKSHSKCMQFGTCRLIQCIKGDAHKVSKYFQNKFEVITLIYTMHHIKKPLIALINIKKILENKGKITIGDYWFTNKKTRMLQVYTKRH